MTDTTNPLDKATAEILGKVGILPARSFVRKRRELWDQLRAATSAEDMRACELMINACGEAIGLSRHDQAQGIIERNIARLDQEALVVSAERERAAIDAWGPLVIRCSELP